MKPLRSTLAAAAAALLFLPALASAQGVTSAAITGTVTDDAGSAIPSATIALVNGSTGQRSQTRTGSDGRYFFENLAVGGPYAIEFRALGFEPSRQAGITLRLGQRLVIDQQLKRTALEVAGVTIEVADTNPYLNAARTGAQSFISENQIARLPTLGRNLTDYTRTVPQVVGSSVAGQNNRFNNIQIDGGVNNDLFGLAGSGTPGGQADAHMISVEAVKEFQLLIAPFDIRQGSFTGGLLNAVTKSGTNEFHGSAWGYAQNENLVGRDVLLDDPPDEFVTNQYGFALGGPLIRDRLHFFASLDLQTRNEPFRTGGSTGDRIGDDTTGGADSVGVGIRRATAERIEQITLDSLNFDPGNYRPPLMDNPDKNIFAKLSLQLGVNSTAEVSYNLVDAGDDNLIRDSDRTGFRDGYQLGKSGYQFATVTSTLRGKWLSQFGRANNELLVGYQTIRDNRDLPTRVPLMLVGGDRPYTPNTVPSSSVAVGADKFSHVNRLDQDIVEITDNLTLPFGAHTLTLGTHNELFSFYNAFFPASLGVWSFADTTAYLAKTPFRYERALELRPGGPATDFGVTQLGFYVQDKFSPRPGLHITAGLRVDMPFMDSPNKNVKLADTSVLAINTGVAPGSGNALLSPRLGMSYDLRGDGSTFLRGGVGIFSGRPPYVWVSNAFGNTGLEQALLVCDGPLTLQTGIGANDSVPVFTADPDNQPSQCRGPAAAPAAPSIVFYDENFKFPQALKVAAGVDKRLPWGVTGTVDFLYTRSLNTFYVSDVNMVGITGYIPGEGGRPLYATTPTGTTVARRDAGFRDVLRHRNEAQDRSVSLTFELNKRFEGGLEFRAGYTYSKTEDLFSLTSSIAFSNYSFTALDGTIESRNLRTSAFDVPHRVVLSGVLPLPAGVIGSLIYTGGSGTPYTWVSRTDANGDGIGGNDPVYVPRNQADITLDANGSAAGLGTPAQQNAAWNTLNNYINGEDCLKQHRGSLLSRNTCRNPWVGFLDARFTKVFETFGAQRFEVSLDLFNVLHMISNEWGVFRQTSTFEEANMLARVGYDAVNQRGIYQLELQQRARNQSTRWRMQLGLKYSL